ncbi:Gp37-like protein [Microbacterium imperiale]|uniref:Gp28/Gp37-like domain-containing protein n=1 Tax=Microbacterium imperiale TaxID=33884 RepID=A0A9W6HF28_9MICO|nr:hypothetical protein [Microbacterium imperiale]MBP2419995.1 hypothetical protein [Microbacterium imperiale]MDS0198141.1 siphovirus ReqiPepy6 Gp37-like family protein [Microbacterium imperiale]BFE40337.1 hypothetical protein GCM10017544_12930 [Microbacterium imperiale]GLJ78687.1 hypothetical protein GCM10017586_03690 [Microbacterium imperiale]
MGDGLKFVIYDKTGAFQRQFEGVDATADLTPNVVPTASFALDDDHEAVPAATEDGARCAVWFRGEERFRGIIQETPGEGPFGQVTAQVRGDLRKLWHWQGRPKPGAEVSAQDREYATYRGPSETVFKTALQENFDRLGVPWTVAPSQGRGSQIEVSFRFHPLAEKLIPALTADGLIVTLAYIGTQVVVDVRESLLVPGVLTVASGIPEEYTFARTGPTVTRVIVGGRGEGVEREFAEVRDADLEAQWGDIIEGFRDARNTDEGADITLDGREALAEGRPTAGVNTTLNETPRFRFGSTYDYGDRVHIQVGPIDRVQPVSVAITESASDGVLVRPRIGEVEGDTNDKLAADVARLARGIRDTGRR